MANTYTKILTHIVFSTKNREPYLIPEIRDRLYRYLMGMNQTTLFKILTIGGTANHVHILLSLAPLLPLAKAVQQIKTNSSRWFHETYPNQAAFSWQEGYGAFSVSISQLDEIRNYIQNQEEHHRKMSFQEEYLLFLKKSGIEYKSEYVF